MQGSDRAHRVASIASLKQVSQVCATLERNERSRDRVGAPNSERALIRNTLGSKINELILREGRFVWFYDTLPIF